MLKLRQGQLTQLVEYLVYTEAVGGSSPSLPISSGVKHSAFCAFPRKVLWMFWRSPARSRAFYLGLLTSGLVFQGQVQRPGIVSQVVVGNALG